MLSPLPSQDGEVTVYLFTVSLTATPMYNTPGYAN